ncbi:1-acyl-sn-glycerol-3-phosphate acyltransferase [Roseovarius sp. M141]|uniref:lysophospholipid acyltransferase family protein n=1 Tax=Roseovarius sp. M141 TaxID=2583806 RepID=UPI0020CC0885|nr:lysophospholipid acyltransferase family protein [Roseovarius sp. M141]MCQ0092838.1 1-acyl-sn-glycerol-3-phosphate acyltransferase [Roseovarius sp. M141]
MTAPPWPRPDPVLTRPAAAGRVRIAVRAALLLSVLAVLLPLLLLVRAVERPLAGLRRPVSGYIVQGFCRAGTAIAGLHLTVRGAPMAQPGAVVANHASWLDIFVLNARHRIVFVSKSEVSGWPVIGFLARLVGTLFIRRDAREAQVQAIALEARLLAGQQLVFFPEGTSTDGLRVLPFKSTLFQAFFAPTLAPMLHVQPVTVIYHAPGGADAAFYGWYGEMDFAPHAAQVFAARRGGRVELIYHTPLRVADFNNRKALATEAERTVRAAMPPDRQSLPD